MCLHRRLCSNKHVYWFDSVFIKRSIKLFLCYHFSANPECIFIGWDTLMLFQKINGYRMINTFAWDTFDWFVQQLLLFLLQIIPLLQLEKPWIKSSQKWQGILSSLLWRHQLRRNLLMLTTFLVRLRFTEQKVDSREKSMPRRFDFSIVISIFLTLNLCALAIFENGRVRLRLKTIGSVHFKRTRHLLWSYLILLVINWPLFETTCRLYRKIIKLGAG